jgi:hypothetical protein
MSAVHRQKVREQGHHNDVAMSVVRLTCERQQKIMADIILNRFFMRSGITAHEVCYRFLKGGLT